MTTHRINAFAKSSFQLPDEATALIFSIFDVQTLCRIAQVCKKFKNLSEGNLFWKPLYAHTWKLPEKWDSLFPSNWKAYFQQAYETQREHQNIKVGNYATFWRKGLVIEAI